MNELSNNDVNTLIEATLIDLRKPEVSPLLRAKLMETFIKRRHTSLRGASKLLGLPVTTAHTWLQYNKLSQEKYDELIESGLSKTQIHNIVKTPSKIGYVEKLDPYQYELEQMLKQARHIRMQTTTAIKPELEGLIKDIINELNRLLIKAK
jgi:hypothetical protein